MPPWQWSLKTITNPQKPNKMNKTVNINLAGLHFHIDETAYFELQRYLNAVKASLDHEGRDEVMSDIEARISELFSEAITSDKQVITTQNVADVIAVMGQPEDYQLEDEQPKEKTSKSFTNYPRKFFRDTKNGYIGGVSSGLSYYFGIDALYVRLGWILLFFGFGTGVLLYILLWILIPEAKTTADRLQMKGKPINISNIEDSFKEGFQNVKNGINEMADTFDKESLKSTGDKIRKGSQSFFEVLGDLILFLFKALGKFIGLFLMIITTILLISFVLSLFSLGTVSFLHPEWMYYVETALTSSWPLWLVSLIAFVLVGVPLVLLLMLGISILSSKSNLMGRTAKFSLLGIWIIALITVLVLGIQEGADFGVRSSDYATAELPVSSSDTLFIEMVGNRYYDKDLHRDTDNLKIVYDEDDQRLIYSSDIRLIVQSTKDDKASLSIEKSAVGASYQQAKDRAQAIDYQFQVDGNKLKLNAYLLTDIKQRFRDQSVELILLLPEGSILYADKNTYSFHRNTSFYGDILDNGSEEHFLRILKNDTECLNCDEQTSIDFKTEFKGEDWSLQFGPNFQYSKLHFNL